MTQPGRIGGGLFHVYGHAERRGSRPLDRLGRLTFLFAGIAVPVYFVRYAVRSRR
jgi:hypothetical protein